MAYFATKVYYFGVGGGLSTLEALVAADGELRLATVHEPAAGVRRAVVRLEWV